MYYLLTLEAFGHSVAQYSIYGHNTTDYTGSASYKNK